MNYKAYSFILFSCVFISVAITSCSSTSESDHSANSTVDTAINEMVTSVNNNPGPPDFSGQEMEVKTFEVIDSTSKKSLGWGYDIYISGKKTIHQPIIPAVPGNNAFSSAEKAKTTGLFAIKKMKISGSLPTLSLSELDSLGVTN